MKKGVIFLLVALLAINFVFAYDLNVTNFSMKTLYAPGEILSGSFRLNLSYAPVNLSFSSEFGTMSLRDFLKVHGKPLSCESVNCSNVLYLTDSGATSKTISLAANETKQYAFAVTDNGVSFNQLSFSFSSNFPESFSLPLEISVGNGLVLSYNNLSENYVRQISYGCYNTGLSSYDETSKVDQAGYCEKMNLKSSNKYIIGAELSGTGLRDFELQLKDSQGLQILGRCNISKDVSTSSSFGDGTSFCKMQTTNMNPEGYYYVCIKDVTQGTNDPSLYYKIRSENSGVNCGYYSTFSSNPAIDYSIYAKVPTYSSASSFSLSANSSSNGLSGISSFIAQNYPSGCANTCVIPFSVRGVPQTLSFNSVDLAYGSTTGPRSANKIYEVSNKTRLVNFSGDLFLEGFNWTVSNFGNQSFNLVLIGDGTKDVLNSSLQVSALPVIDSISPMNPPAGIPVFFFVQIRNPGNSSRYEWDFGDGSQVSVTNTSFALHKYSNISNYTISVRFGEGNYTATRSFVIGSVNPRDALNDTLSAKRIKLNHANTDIVSMAGWYQNALSRIVDLDYYQSELNNIDSARSTAFTDQDFLGIASRLYNLVVPWAVIVTERKTSSLFEDYNSISPSIIQEINPSGINESADAYKSSIFSWELKNVNSSLTSSKVRVFDENGNSRDVMTLFDLNVRSLVKTESYLVIQKDISQITFNSAGASSAKKIGTNTYFILPPEGSLSFSFYLNSSDDPVIFVSPRLNLLALGNSISVCNFNLVCEKSSGENYKNCRSDCAPVVWTWFWLAVLFVFALIAYTVLQVWYKMKYEEYLFKDRNQMYNLLAFIENAKLSKLSISQIKTLLSQRGWDKDQVQYALLKSDGKNTGMFEIIPIDKIAYHFQKKKAVSEQMQKPAVPINAYPMQNGMQRPAFNPLRQQNNSMQRQPQQKQMPSNINKTTTRFGQQSKPKY
jgi:hypothetical protein